MPRTINPHFNLSEQWTTINKLLSNMNLTILKCIVINCVLVDISTNSMKQGPSWESDQLICSISLIFFYGYNAEMQYGYALACKS